MFLITRKLTKVPVERYTNALVTDNCQIPSNRLTEARRRYLFTDNGNCFSRYEIRIRSRPTNVGCRTPLHCTIKKMLFLSCWPSVIG